MCKNAEYATLKITIDQTENRSKTFQKSFSYVHNSARFEKIVNICS